LNIMGEPFGAPVEHLASQHDGHMPAMAVHDGSATGIPTNEPAEIQIARAVSAGPKHVTDGARINGTDAQGKPIVLREGDNGFVCNAGSLHDRCSTSPVQLDQIQTHNHLHAGGRHATQRQRPNDKTSPALAIAPHWMIMMRFDPRHPEFQRPTPNVARTLCGRNRRLGTCTSMERRRTWNSEPHV
jgi:hypothetical protein